MSNLKFGVLVVAAFVVSYLIIGWKIIPLPAKPLPSQAEQRHVDLGRKAEHTPTGGSMTNADGRGAPRPDQLTPQEVHQRRDRSGVAHEYAKGAHHHHMGFKCAEKGLPECVD
jgi:hypothetical protein